MTAQFSEFAKSLTVETAFTVLAAAKALKALGKDVVELEIGDSPFNSTAFRQSHRHQSHRGQPIALLPVAGFAGVPRGGGEIRLPRVQHPRRKREHRRRAGGENLRAVLLRSLFESRRRRVGVQPAFSDVCAQHRTPGARPVFSALEQSREFRPNLDAVEKFLKEDPAPKAIFLNSPHNPTGGVATAGRSRRACGFDSRQERGGLQR